MIEKCFGKMKLFHAVTFNIANSHFHAQENRTYKMFTANTENRKVLKNLKEHRYADEICCTDLILIILK